MSGNFDPYYKWLGIPPKDQPPNHYRLLGIELFESDVEVIEAAANRLMSYLHDLSTGDDAEHAQQLLNEISAARLCLLTGGKKDAYDKQLRDKVAPVPPAKPVARPAAPPKKKAPPPPKPAASPAAANVVSIAPQESQKSILERRPQKSNNMIWIIAGAAVVMIGGIVGAVAMMSSSNSDSGDPSTGTADNQSANEEPNSADITQTNVQNKEESDKPKKPLQSDTIKRASNTAFEDAFLKPTMLVLKVKPEFRKQVKLSIGGRDYTDEVRRGKGRIQIPLLPGLEHDVLVQRKGFRAAEKIKVAEGEIRVYEPKWIQTGAKPAGGGDQSSK